MPLTKSGAGPGGGAAVGADSSLFFESVARRDLFFNTSSNRQLLKTDLPVLVNEGNAVTIFIWTGEDSPASYDATLFIASSTNSGPGTLFLGLNAVALSSTARAIGFKDAYGETALAISTIYDETGHVAPFQWDFSASVDTSIADVFDITLSDPQTMQFLGAFDAITRAYTLRPASSGTLRVRGFAGTTTSAPLIIDTAIIVAPGDVGTLFQVILDNKILIQTGDDILAEFSGIQLFGGLQTSGEFDTQTVPFLRADFATLTKRDLVVQGDTELVIGTTSLDPSAQVQFDSTTRGFLAPRMTEVQRDAISSPSEGLIIYNTDNSKLNIFNGADWEGFGDGLVQTKFKELTSDVSTSSTTFVELLSQNITTEDSMLRIEVGASVSKTGGGVPAVSFRILVDGTPIRGGGIEATVNPSSLCLLVEKSVLAGAHTVSLEWKVSTGTAQIRPVGSPDNESCSMYIQETSV